jgi:DNA (cytosine-5)-methyltransferase 1
VFTLENVPRYQNSQSFNIILSALEQEGYSVTYSVVNMDKFGLPQARRRLVLIASRGFRVALPDHRKPIGWYEAIAHLIPTMSDSQLLPKQQQAVEQFLAANDPTPLLIERVGGRKDVKYKPAHLPCNTILRSHFTDHKGCNRNKFADIWLPDGTVKSLSIAGAAKLQGFPNWYEFPVDAATAGSIIGYSVPPSFASQLFISAQSKLLGVTV